jgi:hypothetical protein
LKQIAIVAAVVLVSIGIGVAVLSAQPTHSLYGPSGASFSAAFPATPKATGDVVPSVVAVTGGTSYGYESHSSGVVAGGTPYLYAVDVIPATSHLDLASSPTVENLVLYGRRVTLHGNPSVELTTTHATFGNRTYGHATTLFVGAGPTIYVVAAAADDPAAVTNFINSFRVVY